MRNLKFRYARAVNFLCFGEEGVEINFEQYGNIVCIKGKNFDVNNEDGTIASNGSGKSSVPEIIVYALFGKTIKKPKKLSHPDIINNKSGNNLMVELIWDKYRLVRTRDANNKGTLRLWESEKGVWNKDTEITIGGVPTTQKEVERKIGLTYEAFINIFIFSDDNTLPFLECDGPTKREIVENLLSLEKYRNYSQSAKDLLKDLKDKIKDLTKDYESFVAQKEAATVRITQIEKQEKDWYDARKKELTSLLNEIRKKRDELEKSKTGTALMIYQDAQEQIVDLQDKAKILEGAQQAANTSIDFLKTKGAELEKLTLDCDTEHKSVEQQYLESDNIISKNKKIIEDVENKTGKECPYCYSVVDEANFADIINKAKGIVDDKSVGFEDLKSQYEALKTKKSSFSDLKKKLDNAFVERKNKLNTATKELSDVHFEISKLSKIQKPDIDVTELLIGEQVESLKKQSVEKQEQLDGDTPFVDIKGTAVSDLAQKIKDCDDKKEEIKKIEKDAPYYEFWVKAFGDSGIRKYVIDGIIPTLNDRIEYWLQFLIDNKIKLTFDNELQETIDRYPFNGRPYVYHGMSGGQRRRLNLTVAAAWAFISALNSGASPSTIFLDEVTMNMDIVGIQGIFRMICELAKEKQVFVIDHNETLLQMLDGCDTIYLEMQDEISTKVVDTCGSN
jgi:DNA repair exonuclease SbcCD ATPase subunit